MSKQLSRKQDHAGVITTAAAQAESIMLRPHNAAASRWLHFVATTQRRRKSLAAHCGDHMTLPQPLAALCGDHMMPLQCPLPKNKI